MNINGVNFPGNNREQNQALLSRHQESKRFKDDEDQKLFMQTVVTALQRHIAEMKDLVNRTQDNAEKHRLLANIRVNQADVERYQRKIKLLTK